MSASAINLLRKSSERLQDTPSTSSTPYVLHRDRIEILERAKGIVTFTQLRASGH